MDGEEVTLSRDTVQKMREAFIAMRWHTSMPAISLQPVIDALYADLKRAGSKEPPHGR
jgi:hypothetical protein